MVVQWLRPHIPNARAPGLIPGQGTRSNMLQLRLHSLQLKKKKKFVHATAKRSYMPCNEDWLQLKAGAAK